MGTVHERLISQLFLEGSQKEIRNVNACRSIERHAFAIAIACLAPLGILTAQRNAEV